MVKSTFVVSVLIFGACNKEPSVIDLKHLNETDKLGSGSKIVTPSEAGLLPAQEQELRGIAILENRQRKLDAERAEQVKSYDEPLPQVTIGTLNQATPAVEVSKRLKKRP